MGDKTINGSTIKKCLTKKEDNRSINIEITTDGTEAYMTINYDKFDAGLLYSASQIKQVLMDMGIVFGLKDENIRLATREFDVKEVLVAEGIKIVEDTEDTVDVKFAQKKHAVDVDDSAWQKVDYRDVGEVTSVKKDDVMAVKIPGKDGEDGTDVYGSPIRRKRKKKVSLKVGEGCTLLDENTVIATIQGEPYIKNNVFCVYQVHTINSNISLETGDVVFVGDIKIVGSVKEGMTVESGNTLTIQGDVESANIIAKGDITISGNSIMSTITAGGTNMKISKYISILEDAKDMLTGLVETVSLIRRENFKMSKIPEGELIKGLIETKYKDLSKRCWGILKECFDYKEGEEDALADEIKSKLIGMAPLSIKNYNELSDIIDMMDERIEELEGLLTVTVNVNVGYCQDCKIESSGNVIISGSGQYVSDITAEKGIYFVKDGSVARGGTLKAKGEIICKTVGSQGGVKTKLIVGKKGHIKAGIAYEGTTLVVGTREAVIDTASINVHAYLNKDRELVVDKLKKV